MSQFFATLLGAFITKRANDKEAERKFIELAQHLQAKKLISARMKWGRQDNLDELAKKREEAKRKNEEAQG
jgi:hypothetical protein